ncbi:MAG: hypothetical protein RIT17_757, partial [Pseudomonadota bacterium]
MADDKDTMAAAADNIRGFFDMQGEAMREMFANAMGGGPMSADGLQTLMPQGLDVGELGEWAGAATQLQQLWLDFATYQASQVAEKAAKGGNGLDPAQWLVLSQSMLGQMPKDLFAAQARLAQDSLQLWQGVAQQFLAGAATGSASEAPDPAALPKNDRRFADPAWRAHPAFLLLHQTYLMMADYFRSAVKGMDGLDRAKRQQLDFAVSALTEAMSPDNFLGLNPVVLKRTMETKGANLVRGMQHLINDLKRGQLTHTDPNAFRLGENLAATPG